MKKESFLSEQLIKEWCPLSTFIRGEKYIDHVLHLVLIKDTLHAHVQGNQAEPYQVKISLKNQEWKHGYCSCPSNKDPCKHLIAALLKYVRQGIDSLESLINQIIEKKSQSQLKHLLFQLVEMHPFLIDDIQIFLLNPAFVSPSGVVINTQVMTKKIEKLFAISEGAWKEEEKRLIKKISEIEKLFQLILSFLEKEDGKNALTLLQAITEPLIIHFAELREEGYDHLLKTLEQLWIEAFLLVTLTSKEKRTWIYCFGGWNEKFFSGFENVLEVIEQGWNVPILHAALHSQKFFESFDPELDLNIAKAAFHLLYLRKDFDTCLNLAQLAHLDEDYISLLIERNQLTQAEDLIKKKIHNPDLLLKFSKQFYALNDVNQALAIACLYQPLYESDWNAYALLIWTRDLAFELKQPALGIEKGIQVFKMKPSLQDYQILQKHAKSQWNDIKPALLTFIQSKSFNLKTDVIKILLEEKMIDEALKMGEQFPSTPEFLIDTMILVRPEWSMHKCQELTLKAIEKGSMGYDDAIEWLKKSLKAAKEAKKMDEGLKFLQNLIERNQRKRNLLPKLQAIIEHIQT